MFNALIPRHRMGCLVTVAALWLLWTGVVLAADPPCPAPLVERQRYGFVATSANWPQRFDFAQLGAGWYVDTGPSVTPAVGLDRALVVKIRAGYTIDPEMLGSLVDEYPGALWLIGNEPDCIWQDNVTPEEYARIYHNLYYFIKNRDGTSQIAAGSIVQPTPLRLQYLDRALSSYRARYGRAMPVDVWNIHNAILNEVSCNYDPDNCWGAGIPPGIDADVGVIRSVQDNDNMTIFQDQVWTFRAWMADRGYIGYPLVVTEYGILMPEEYGFSASRVNAFMSGTFSFLSTAVDASLGDPTDGYRLVQRWAWFSLDVQPWDPITREGFNGNLFDPVTMGITAYGQHYADHTYSFPPLEYSDLGIAAWDTPLLPLVISPTQTISYSLVVKIVNRGMVGTAEFAVTLAYSGPTSGTLAQVVADAPAASSRWLTFTLENLQVGGYLLALELDPDDKVAEADECNNLVTRTLVVPRHRYSLPLVLSRMAVTTRRESQNQAGASGGQRPALVLSQPAGTAEWRSRKANVSARPDVQHLPLQDGAAALTGLLEFEMPTANSYPAQLARDAEEQVLWITERDSAKLAAFDLLSQTWGAEYELVAGSQPWGVAVDQAGNVWFAETGVGRIGKLDVGSGIVTEYSIPTQNSQPWDIAVGGDGIIWFTEKGGSKIGKLVPGTGEVTEYPLPSPGEQPGGIAAAYDKVWFTLTAPDQLGRLKIETGLIETLGRPPGSRPQDIVLTSASNPWFTEAGANRIVGFSPSTLGWWTEVDVPTPNAEPYGIAMEGNVAVWFTERAGNKLGRYSGTVPPREYSLLTPYSLPTGIVVDDAGCAWYTAPGANRIGRFCVPEYAFDAYLPLLVENYSPVH